MSTNSPNFASHAPTSFLYTLYVAVEKFAPNASDDLCLLQPIPPILLLTPWLFFLYTLYVAVEKAAPDVFACFNQLPQFWLINPGIIVVAGVEAWHHWSFFVQPLAPSSWYKPPFPPPLPYRYTSFEILSTPLYVVKHSIIKPKIRVEKQVKPLILILFYFVFLFFLHTLQHDTFIKQPYQLNFITCILRGWCTYICLLVNIMYILFFLYIF